MHVLVFVVQIILAIALVFYALFFAVGVLVFFFAQQGRKPRRLLMWTLLAIGVFGLSLRSYYLFAPKPQDITWGVTFSQKMAGDLGFDSDASASAEGRSSDFEGRRSWKDMYRAVLYDLRPKVIRLVAYWDIIEPQKGAFNFSDLDFQIGEAAQANVPVVLAIGEKVPRWPECHYPKDLELRNQDLVQERFLRYLETVVRRYKDSSALAAWQVENEPFFLFGECPLGIADSFSKKVSRVRELDPAHPIFGTDSGEFGEWYRAANPADALGVTLYRTVHHKTFGRVTYPFPPEFYALKRDVVKFFTGKRDQQFTVAELDAEPWGSKQISEMTADEQADLFSLDDLVSTVGYARRTGFGVFYFWGVEWWYQRKTQYNDSRYWDYVKTVLSSNP